MTKEASKRVKGGKNVFSKWQQNFSFDIKSLKLNVCWHGRCKEAHSGCHLFAHSSRTSHIIKEKRYFTASSLHASSHIPH